MIRPENILSHEIVGLAAEIVESSDLTLERISGTIVLETKNMVSIRTDFTVKQVAKKAARKIAIKTDSGVCFISGSSLIGRPEDRIARMKN